MSEKRTKGAPGNQKLDTLDCKLIRLLQQDGRMPNKAIAKELQVSEFTVRRRLKRLLDEKLIKIVAVSDPMKLGYEIVGISKIRIDLKKTDHVLKKLSEIDCLNWLALTTGGADVDIEFFVRSLKEFQDLIYNRISQINGIISVETSLVVDLIKDEYEFGTAWDNDGQEKKEK